GSQAPPALGAASLLDFSVGVTLDGEALRETELRQLAQAADGLVRLRGRWVEADGEKLAAALEHWRSVAREAAAGGLSFYDGMRLLAGAAPGAALTELPEALREWSGIEAGPGLRARLERLRHPEAEPDPVTAGVTATLRPYQKTGVKWLRLMSELGLGACLADDMGLGKTLQVIALLAARTRADGAGPSLVIAPASLLANWQNEFARFAPKLRTLVAHPAESDLDLHSPAALGRALQKIDVTITTYGLIGRCEALRKQAWDVLVLDEAQAIKNPGARQTRAVKTLQGRARIALTGTPIENRLSDLWSLFDFLNPGLLGSARVFAEAAKRLAKAPEAYAPLRRLVQPYILRRLKTDRRVIADLPEKTELNAYCGLTREQAALYQRCVRELARTLERAEGMARRGAVLAHLMQLKQICNHPAQWAGEARCAPERSGKFLRLAELCGELAERQARVLVFTQFREIIAPLEAHLAGIFGRPGLTLHGGTAVRERQRLVERFQREDGPPFFILSLKAGGTGLNLTAAAHVIHFDRWWNPAVENQATDRAFRIGQRRNVLVHKFICRGTIEEKIAALIEAKQGLAQELLGEGAERLLTEMSDAELLSMVALDLNKACEA
ncbi:MAG: SNF2-related protein, partial [Pseudomonadota bacterium]|nr:SNF2-related protein [Pseudomonadota bacterium]